MATFVDAAEYMHRLFGASDVRAMLVRAAAQPPPCSPLREWLRLRHQSPASVGLSYPSEGSLESILSHNASLAAGPTATAVPAAMVAQYEGGNYSGSSNSVSNSASNEAARASEQAETDRLIYRLCCSLYKRAVQMTSDHVAAGRFHHVPTDPTHERNMSRMAAWMPLLHLFDPTRFYAYNNNNGSVTKSGDDVSGGDGALACAAASASAATAAAASSSLLAPNANGSSSGGGVVAVLAMPRAAQPEAHTGAAAASASQLTALTPREASRKLLDELDVEKLSGGNSNHVYRLCHPQFPDKSILLRVYGGGSAEAIDRYRDTAAMRLMSQSALSPAVLHSFHWGRVEEFMDNVVTCTTDMLLASAELLGEVYETLHDVHRLPYDAFLPKAVNRDRYKDADALAPLLREEGSPEHYCHANVARLTSALQRSTCADEYYTDDAAIKAMEDLSPSGFVRTSLRFLRLASNLIAPAYRGGFVHFVCDQVAQLHALLQQHRVPLVFSHNDLTPGNVLLSRRKVPHRFRRALRLSDSDEDEVTEEVSTHSTPLSRKFVTKKGRVKNLVDLKGIVCIDFEYADVNYRCYDLGNTICELDYDYSRSGDGGANDDADGCCGGDGDDDDGAVAAAAAGPGFIKYLHTFPPAAYRARWRGLPMDYPRMPEVIYDAWQTQCQQQQQQQQQPGDDDVSNATCSDTAAASASIGESCLRAIQAYFRGRRREAPRPITQHQLTEVFLGMLAAHLNWALWSLVLGCNPDACTNNTDSDDNFAKGSSGLDYVSYGNCRLREYISLRHWLVAKGVL